MKRLFAVGICVCILLSVFTVFAADTSKIFFYREIVEWPPVTRAQEMSFIDCFINTPFPPDLERTKTYHFQNCMFRVDLPYYTAFDLDVIVSHKKRGSKQ